MLYCSWIAKMASTDRMPLNHHIRSVVQWSQVIHSSMSFTQPMITCHPLVACHWIITFIHSFTHHMLSTDIMSFTHPMITCHPLIACHWIMTFIHLSNDHMLSNHPCHSLITHHPLKTCYPNPANLDFFWVSRVRFVDLEQSQQRWVWMACLQWMACDERMTRMSA